MSLDLRIAIIVWVAAMTLVVSSICFATSNKPWSKRLTLEIGGLLTVVGLLIYLLISLVKWAFLL